MPVTLGYVFFFGICFEMENSGERGRGKTQKTQEKKKIRGRNCLLKKKLVGFKKFWTSFVLFQIS